MSWKIYYNLLRLKITIFYFFLNVKQYFHFKANINPTHYYSRILTRYDAYNINGASKSQQTKSHSYRWPPCAVAYWIWISPDSCVYTLVTHDTHIYIYTVHVYVKHNCDDYCEFLWWCTTTQVVVARPCHTLFQRLNLHRSGDYVVSGKTTVTNKRK